MNHAKTDQSIVVDQNIKKALLESQALLTGFIASAMDGIITISEDQNILLLMLLLRIYLVIRQKQSLGNRSICCCPNGIATSIRCISIVLVRLV